MIGLLTAREVAEALGMSAETILRWTRAGKLPAIRLPSGAIRYREADIDQWIAARATSPDADIPPIAARNPRLLSGKGVTLAGHRDASPLSADEGVTRDL